MHLSLPDAKKILLPLFTPKLQEQIQQLFSLAIKTLVRVDALIDESDKDLLAALNIMEWRPPKPLTYNRRAFEVVAANRIDAEYFAPEKEYALRLLHKLGGPTIGEAFCSIREMYDPSEHASSAKVRNFDVTHALQPELTDEQEPVEAGEIGSMKKTFANGDVVISRLRSYLREIAIVRTSDSIPSVGSSEFIVLRQVGKHKKLSPEALLIFLRSQPVQAILKWCRDGSQHPRFDEKDLLSITIPNVVWTHQQQITDKVQAAFSARRRATELLETAKRAGALLKG
jgi:hypothetical protein